MAFIPTPDAIRVAIRGRLFGQDIINTLWFSITGGGIDEAVCTSLANDVIDWWSINMLPLLTDDYTFEDVTATSQDSDTAPSIVEPGAGAGGDIGNSLPSGTCFTIQFRTANRGRSGRGRNYISGINENDRNGNQLTLARAGEFVAAYDLLRTAPLLAGGALWIVCSLYTNGAPRANGFKQAINSVGYSNLDLDSQRRRLTGRGS